MPTTIKLLVSANNDDDDDDERRKKKENNRARNKEIKVRPTAEVLPSTSKNGGRPKPKGERQIKIADQGSYER